MPWPPRKNLLSLTVAFFAVAGIAALIAALLPIPNVDDPPVHVRGGSFDLLLESEAYDPALKTFQVHINDTAYTLGAFDQTGLPSTWTRIQICTDSSCVHGINMDSKPGNYALISLISSTDRIAKGETQTNGKAQQTEYEVQDGAVQGGTTAFRPQSVVIFDKGVPSPARSCNPKIARDWQECWVKVGKP